MELFWNVFIPVLIFIGLGVVAGLLLSIFSKIFAVPNDERIDAVRECLPGLNCGVCGYSGCDNYAAAIVKDGARTNRCVPGGDEAAKKISAVLGTEAEDVIETAAFVACGGCVPEVTSDMYDYQGEKTCAACNLYYKGKGVCDYACLGFGDCAKQCSFGAISFENGIASVDPAKCTGCTMCTKACPKNLIHIRELAKNVAVTCSSRDPGKIVIKKCSHGCIACKKCEKVCPNGAIKVENNVASIDYSKCTNCHACVEACPRSCINLIG